MSERYDANDKLHAVRMSPILGPESASYVHHMLLYGCPNDLAEVVGYEHLGSVPDSESVPIGWDAARFASAAGGTDIVLSDDVGVPFGEGNTWTALPVHYYNHSLDTGIVDQSGLRAYLAPTLRPIDDGFMVLNGGGALWSRIHGFFGSFEFE